MEPPLVFIDSPNLTKTEEFMEAKYEYTFNKVEKLHSGTLLIKPVTTNLAIRTEIKIPKVCVMLVGLGGNNGTTFAAGIIANKRKITWKTKQGTKSSNWLGSIVQSSTLRLGASKDGVHHVPMNRVLPLVNPDDLIVDGWDISSLHLASATERAQVLDRDLLIKLKPYLWRIKPRPSIYNPKFISPNQKERADNILEGSWKEQVDKIRADIREMKEKVEKVIVVWTASTEKFSENIIGVHDTCQNILAAVDRNDDNLSPSSLFAIASILEQCTFINGSPQNELVPGIIQLAERHGVFIAGNDFKTGQTKLKSVMVDFLLNAGIKPVSIVSYNHLGNNDGKNLTSEQFKSKEISKKNAIDNMVEVNQLLYRPGEKVDHVVDIKYVPHAGDTKKALDEYTSEIMFNGLSCINIHNTCEDSLLATPVILDMVILAELASRITFRSKMHGTFVPFLPNLSILNCFSKAPLPSEGEPIANGLSNQRACIENLFRACIGLAPEHSMGLEYKLPQEIFSHIENVKIMTMSFIQIERYYETMSHIFQ